MWFLRDCADSFFHAVESTELFCNHVQGTTREQNCSQVSFTDVRRAELTITLTAGETPEFILVQRNTWAAQPA